MKPGPLQSAPMKPNAFLSWVIVLFRLMGYFVYRLGWGKRPSWMNIRHRVVSVCGTFLGWDRRIRFEGVDHCPEAGPAIFAANHQDGTDAFHMFRGVLAASRGKILPRLMMREGLVDGTIFKSKLVDADELAEMVGAIRISRDNVQLSQMKPFVNALCEGDSFLIFPGRTRSHSGLLFEYRDAIREPGSVSFFVAQAQRRNPERRVAVVPACRTWNPVTRMTVIVFGEPHYLREGAGRAEQRAFDLEFTAAMSRLLEINVPHILSGILYLRCLHNARGPLSFIALQGMVADALREIPNRHIDPAAKTDPAGELRRTLRYLDKRGMIEFRGKSVEPNSEAILAAPPVDAQYRRNNPVKYLTNQILHLSDVTAAIERVVLRSADVTKGTTERNIGE